VEKKRLSIAAGFNFSDGVMLCADTRHTGMQALYASKIFRKEYPNGAKSVFAVSGNNLAYFRMAVQECEYALGVLDAASQSTQRQMRVQVEDALKRIDEDHVQRDKENRKFSFVVCLYSPLEGGTLKLYQTDESAIFEAPGYVCVGAGEYLAHYLIRPMYQQGLSLEQVSTIAISALIRVKEYDALCGGRSEFIVVKNDGTTSEIGAFDIDQGEYLSEEFDRAARPLFLLLGNPALDEEEFRKAVNNFVRSIQNLRDRSRNAKWMQTALMETLRKPFKPLWLFEKSENTSDSEPSSDDKQKNSSDVESAMLGGAKQGQAKNR
jgi:20S proteasome alpha/beta subunit